MEYDLIVSAQKGDENAVDKIVKNFKTKVKAIARGYFLIGGDLDDLVQEGMIGLSKAIKSFDKSKSDDFNAFALMCVNREIINCIKKNNSDKNKTLNYTVSLDGIAENAFKTTSPESIVLDREENDFLLKAIDEQLSEFERTAVLAYIKGFSYGEIALQNNVDAKAVDNALQRARTKLAKFLHRGK